MNNQRVIKGLSVSLVLSTTDTNQDEQNANIMEDPAQEM